MNKTILLIASLVFFTFRNQAQTVIDIDGNSYDTIKIGSQVWLKENLLVTHYNNGDLLSNIIDNIQWGNLTTGACCSYNNDTNNSITYGRLYNWYAASDNRNVCPNGWHIPANEEYGTLIDYLGGINVAGGKMKEAGTTHWLPPNTGATNESGFTGLPGGYRNGINGTFEYQGAFGHWWSGTQYDASEAWGIGLFYLDVPANQSESIKRNGFSIRCIKNSTSHTDSFNNFKSLHIYPNPATDKIIIDYAENENLYLSVYNLQGALLLPGEINKNTNKLDISSLSKGIYFLQLIGPKVIMHQKFIKE
jgi:uncharacterized protein (TIGR02145 family)